MVLELLHVLFVFGLLIELLPVSPCRLKNVDTLQAPDKMGLVRAESFRLSADLDPRRPPWT